MCTIVCYYALPFTPQTNPSTFALACELTDEEIPKTLGKKSYFDIENKFQKFSKKVGIEMDELDLLFWSNESGLIFK